MSAGSTYLWDGIGAHVGVASAVVSTVAAWIVALAGAVGDSRLPPAPNECRERSRMSMSAPSPRRSSRAGFAVREGPSVLVRWRASASNYCLRRSTRDGLHSRDRRRCSPRGGPGCLLGEASSATATCGRSRLCRRWVCRQRTVGSWGDSGPHGHREGEAVPWSPRRRSPCAGLRPSQAHSERAFPRGSARGPWRCPGDTCRWGCHEQSTGDPGHVDGWVGVPHGCLGRRGSCPMGCCPSRAVTVSRWEFGVRFCPG